MIISHKYKFIFIKTRKVAGSSIEKFLYPYLDHKTDVLTGSPSDGVPQLNLPKILKSLMVLVRDMRHINMRNKFYKIT